MEILSIGGEPTNMQPQTKKNTQIQPGHVGSQAWVLKQQYKPKELIP
jgi:hypothetical protein